MLSTAGESLMCEHYATCHANIFTYVRLARWGLFFAEWAKMIQIQSPK